MLRFGSVFFHSSFSFMAGGLSKKNGYFPPLISQEKCRGESEEESPDSALTSLLSPHCLYQELQGGIRQSNKAPFLQENLLSSREQAGLGTPGVKPHLDTLSFYLEMI